MFLAMYILVTIILKKAVFSFETMFSILFYDIIGTICNTVIMFLIIKCLLENITLYTRFY